MLKILCGRILCGHKGKHQAVRLGPNWSIKKITPGKWASIYHSQNHQPICPGNMKMTIGKLGWMLSLERWLGFGEREWSCVSRNWCWTQALQDLDWSEGKGRHSSAILVQIKARWRQIPLDSQGKSFSSTLLDCPQQYWFLDRRWWSPILHIIENLIFQAILSRIAGNSETQVIRNMILLPWKEKTLIDCLKTNKLPNLISYK